MEQNMQTATAVLKGGGWGVKNMITTEGYF